MQGPTMQMVLQGAIGNKLINKHSLSPSGAVSNQWNKMLVVDAANDLNLRLKFSFTLPTSSF